MRDVWTEREEFESGIEKVPLSDENVPAIEKYPKTYSTCNTLTRPVKAKK